MSDDALTAAELQTLIALLDAAAVRLSEAPAALALRSKLENQLHRLEGDSLDAAARRLTEVGLR